MNELDAASIDALDDFELTDEVTEEVQENPDNKDNSDSQDPSDSPEDTVVEETPETEPNTPEDIDDFTTEVLKLKGISDPNKIKFQDESGAIIEKSWDDLSRTEQLNILTQEGNPETDLEEPEIELINSIRGSGLSVEEFINAIQQEAVAQAESMRVDPPKIYEIDSLEDDELFALDLLEKVGEENITDEELKEALEKAKENENLYQKQVDALRVQYKALEDENILKHQQEEAALAEQQYQNFSNDILNQIEGFNTVAGQEIELSIDDKNDLANFILTRDENGITDFGKAMNNPRTLTTVAFWALKGPEIMQELQAQIQEAYKRGFNEGKVTAPVVTPKKTTPLVIQPKTPKVSEPAQTPQTKPVNSIQDALAAFGDDESYLYN